MQTKQQQRIQAHSIDGELIKEQIHKHRHTMQNASLALAELPLAKAVKALSKPMNPVRKTGSTTKPNETESS